MPSPTPPRRVFTRLVLATTVAVVAITALPLAYVLNGPKWGTRTVNYYINPANSDVSEAAAEAAIQAGAATWGSQSAADFRFYYMGRTTGSVAMNNGKNEMFFRNVSAGGTVAETYWWADASGRLIDADILFYDGGITFFTGTSGCSGGLYIEDTAAHEFGHALGLGHSAAPDATMYYVTGWCSTNGRSLAPDDLAGVEALYPPSSAPRNVAPTVSLTSPADGASYAAPATIAVTATAGDSDGSVSKVDFLANGSVVATDTTAPYSATLSNLGAGGYVLTAIATDNAGATATSAARTATVTAVVTGTPGAATYVTTDATTQGTWKGVYGTEGYSIAADATSLPSYAQLTITGQSSWTWTPSTADVRAMQRAGSDRVMAAWYGASFAIDVNVTGTQPRTLALYAADFDNNGRQQRYDLTDANTGALLDSRTISGFGGGQYVVWSVIGRVRIQVTRLAGVNAVVSGVVFGGGAATGGGGSGTAAGSTVTYVKTDATSQGTWKSSYGGEGQVLAADTTQLPADTQVTLTGQSQWTWMASTTDVRALQRSGSDRVMAAWYGDAFSIDVNVTGPTARQVALYSADYDYGARQQRFDLVDPSNGTVLDTRTISSFTSGQYVVWNVRGHVLIRVTRLTGPNAVVSGVLIGGASTAAAGSSVTFLATDTVTQGTWMGVYGGAGYSITADASSLPSFLQMLMSGSNAWTWASSTSDVRALQRTSTGRVMAATYGMAFSIDVNLTDGAEHQVAIYSADYDYGLRRQRFDVVDAASGALLDSRTISGFSGGVYSVWTMRGHVIVKVTSLAGPNAVVSGLFVK
ncbi:MAG: Ig-like domain-containing protein [Vicinamibacterales bacterium]